MTPKRKTMAGMSEFPRNSEHLGVAYSNFERTVFWKNLRLQALRNATHFWCAQKSSISDIFGRFVIIFPLNFKSDSQCINTYILGNWNIIIDENYTYNLGKTC